jgi:hypothetical protein
MSARGLWLAVFASVVLLGCAAGRFPDGAAPNDHPGKHARYEDQACDANGNHQKCDIVVTVDCGSGICTAVVDPKVLLINSNGVIENLTITWTLNDVSGDYGFVNTGIAGLQGGHVKCDPHDFSKKTVKCMQQPYDKGAVITYTVEVGKPSQPNLTVDPWIVNN